MTRLKQLTKMQFDYAHFRVKIHDLPMKMNRSAFTEFVASKLGKYVVFNDSNLTTLSNNFKIKVDIDIQKSFRQEIQMFVRGKARWVVMKHV